MLPHLADIPNTEWHLRIQSVINLVIFTLTMIIHSDPDYFLFSKIKNHEP